MAYLWAASALAAVADGDGTGGNFTMVLPHLP